MSAFMCSDDHIRVLAIAATYGTGREAVYTARRDAQQIEEVRRYKPQSADARPVRLAARTLVLANAAALRDRYGSAHDRFGDAVDETGAGPEIAEADVARLAPHLTPACIAKLVACYQYQACDWEGFQGSDAERLTWNALERAMRCLPGYDAAPWGI